MTPLSTQLEELARKVEAPDGLCRETDAAIVMALYPEAQIGEYCGYEEVVFHAEPLVENKEFLPFFTASVDAALTLIPTNWLVVRLSEIGWAGGWQAELGNPGIPQDAVSDAGARTPALAITAAALRAIALAQRGE